jgi:hypothetical protein
MAHFAKLNKDNIVVFVTVGREEDDGKEKELFERTGDVYKQTSYNTRAGIHYKPNSNEPSENQSKALRKNYAGIGYTYDEERDAFIPPKPFTKWILNENTCQWEAPAPYPDDGKNYVWNDNKGEWEEVISD